MNQDHITNNFASLDFDYNDDMIVWTSRGFPALIKINCDFSAELKYLIYEKEYSSENIDQYSGIAVTEENIIVAPFRGNMFLLLDKRGNRCRSIKLEELCNGNNYGKELKFMSAVKYHDKIFFAGYEIPVLICYEIKERKFREIREYKEKVSNVLEGTLIMRQMVFKNHLYLIMWGKNGLTREENGFIDIDMEKEIIEVYPLKVGEDPNAMCEDEEALWFGFQTLPYILKYSKGTRKTEKISCELLINKVFWMISSGDQIYFIGNAAGNLLSSFMYCFDKTEKKMLYCMEEENLGFVMAVKKKSDENILILSEKKGQAVISMLNTSTKQIVRKELYVNDAERVKMLEIMLDNRQIVFEGMVDLRAFLEAMVCRGDKYDL